MDAIATVEPAPASDAVDAAAERSALGGLDRASEPVMLTVEDMGRLLNCSARSIYRLAEAGRIPRPVRLGGLRRWHRPMVERWLDAGCPMPRAVRR